MALNELDQARLADALLRARQVIGVSDPNPRVGCVLGHEDGRIFGAGATQEAGGPHAEVMALRAAQAAGHDLRGATAWVTLEPCAHHGRTPPCCDALIAAGIGRVVVATQDPFPLVAGAGIARMRAAGVVVELAGGAIAEEARELNIGFFSRVVRQRPWVRMKIAASLDGRTALLNGRSQWITGVESRTDGHAWRKRAGAVLTGIGTVLEDDPRLDVRLVPTVLQPLRVVVDSRLQLPPGAKIIKAPGRVLVATVSDDAQLLSDWRERGVEVALLPGKDGKVDLPALLTELAQRGVNELHVEAGHKLNGSLIREGLVDELLVYLAPMLIGPGREMAALAPLDRLVSASEFEFHDMCRIGADIRILARPPGRAEF